MKDGFSFLFDKLRLGKPWKYKFPLLLSFTYIWLIHTDRGVGSILLAFSASICTALGFAAFGYIINDWSDEKSDLLAEKPNSLEKLNLSLKYLFLFISLLFALLPWMYLPFDKYSFYLIFLEILLFLIYSFPPFRLKEKGIFGLFVDSGYAHVVPALLASWTFYLFAAKSEISIKSYLYVLIIWQFISGIRNILSHQLLDIENDIQSGVKTFATKYGKRFGRNLQIYLLVPLELMSFAFYLYYIKVLLSYPLIVLTVFLIYSFYNFFRNRKYAETNLKHFTNVFLDDAYNAWFPLYLLVIIGVNEPLLWLIFIIHSLLFTGILKRAKKIYAA